MWSLRRPWIRLMWANSAAVSLDTPYCVYFQVYHSPRLQKPKNFSMQILASECPKVVFPHFGHPSWIRSKVLANGPEAISRSPRNLRPRKSIVWPHTPYCSLAAKENICVAAKLWGLRKIWPLVWHARVLQPKAPECIVLDKKEVMLFLNRIPRSESGFQEHFLHSYVLVSHLGVEKQIRGSNLQAIW
jgi:hypothetical protein